MSTRRNVRVVIVDDSALALDVLRDMLARAADIEIAGAATEGRAALELVHRLRPDVLLTDLHMPGLDGLDLTHAVMDEAPLPILIVSASTTEQDVFRLLAAGAVDVFLKPETVSGPAYEHKARELVDKVRILSGVHAMRRRHVRPPPPPTGPLEPVDPGCVVAIGASTGGPQALRDILTPLRADFPVPIVCVQHIADGFLQGLVEWLDKECALRVKVAEHGETARPGHVYFAPESAHLSLDTGRILNHSRGPPIDGHIPSVTALFRSVAHACGETSIGILLTGMGSDGAQGLRVMRDHGALTIAQDAATSLVYGMPAKAVAQGAARHVLPLPAIVDRLQRLEVRKSVNG